MRRKSLRAGKNLYSQNDTVGADFSRKPEGALTKVRAIPDSGDLANLAGTARAIWRDARVAKGDGL